MANKKIALDEFLSNRTWKKSISFPEIEASSDGLLRLGVDRPINRRSKRGYIYAQIKVYHRRKNGVMSHPYYHVSLSINGKRKELLVHRIVCEAFHGVPPKGIYFAAHKDGNSLNNKKENLYWATPKQNSADREKHGRTIRGSLAIRSILTEEDIPKIRSLLSKGKSCREIGSLFGVSYGAISNIKNGNNWKHCQPPPERN